jgi:Reverse transcriptase (RNA-dependent DNA polymerase)
LFNLSNAVRDRIAAKLPTCVFFLDAHKAYDTVEHVALLDRLVAKGVTGKAWRVIDQLYANATCRTRVDGELSAAFTVGRGVAQGCPLSPFLYDIFVDSLFEDVQAECAADGIHIGEEGTAAYVAMVIQVYADDMMGMAATPEGLQRIIDAMHRHSEKWGWTANVKKSVVMVFGDVASRTALATVSWQWAHTPLQHHLAEKVKTGQAAFHQRAPVLASTRIHVNTKLVIINAHIRPVLEYGMEVWGLSTGAAEADLFTPL